MTVVDRAHRTETATGTEQPRLRRNDYSPLRPPEIGTWEPALDVSVVVPARGGQRELDLVLAALAAQTYPSHLMEVIVVDDASDPPLVLPEIVPENTELVSADPGGWGSAYAVNTGVAVGGGAVVMRLDADMLVYRDHVESQMRWHHLADYLAVLGHKLFTEKPGGELGPEAVHAAVREGRAAELFDRETAWPHWIERFIDRHDALRAAGHMAYHVFVGASGSLHRDLLHAAGPLNPDLALGGDAEFAYRVGQAGAVFIPDVGSSSWHLGRSQMQARRDEGADYRAPYLANRMPLLNSRRRSPGRQWAVPYIDVVVDCAGASARRAQDTVGALLAGDLADIRITLLGDWSALTGERHDPLEDPLRDTRLIHEAFRAEPRVRFEAAEPPEDPAVTFRLRWPVACPPSRSALSVMTETANTTGVGLLRVVPPTDAVDPHTAPPRLERRAAFARARHLSGDDGGEDLDTLVDRIYGVHWMDGTGTVVATGEEEPGPPADWRLRLEEWQKKAQREKARADRLERRIRWATRAHPKRMLRRLLLARLPRRPRA